MDMRDKLLHNEILNLGQMVQIVSYELTLLSDFMKEKFGPSYEAFRQKHSQQNILPQSSRVFVEPERIPPKKVNLTARKSTSPLKRSHHQEGDRSELKRLKIERVDLEDDDGDLDIEEAWGSRSDGAFDDFEISADDSVTDDDPLMVVGDEDVNITSGIGTRGSLGQRVIFPKQGGSHKKNIGRGRSDIWNKFIISKLPNGKLHAKCPNCEGSVSSKVERLTSHYRKCILGEGKITAKVDKTQSEICIEEADKMKVKEYIKALKETLGSSKNAGGDDKAQRKSTSSLQQGDSESTSGGGGNQNEYKEVVDHVRSVGGRKHDPVWDYFKVLENPETKKRIVKCKRCDVQVSSKVERVRRHFVICLELDKEGDNHNESANSEVVHESIDIS